MKISTIFFSTAGIIFAGCSEMLGYMLNDNFSITIEAFIVYLFLMLVLIYILSFVENLQENFFR